METSCKLSFHGASGNSCPHSLLCVEAPCSTTNDGKAAAPDADAVESTESNNQLADTVIYASSGVINLATSHTTTSNNCITSVAKTLITRTLDHSSAPLPSIEGNNDAAAAAASTKRVLARGEAIEDAAASRSVTALAWFAANGTAAATGADATPSLKEAPPSSSSSSNNHLVVLISEGNFNFTQTANQKNALQLLADLSLPYTTIDGMDPDQREKRNELFDISGIRGNYPQFFLCKGQEYEFLGNYEWLESCNLDELQKSISVMESSNQEEAVADKEEQTNDGKSDSSTSFGIVSAFSDGTVTLWNWKNTDLGWVEHVLIGHDPDPAKRAKHHVDQDGLDGDNLQESIADISAVSLGSNTTLVATASSKASSFIFPTLYRSSKRMYTLDRSVIMPLHPFTLLKQVRMSAICFMVYTLPHYSGKDMASSSNSSSAWVTLPVLTVCDPICQGSLLGHQDWITCFAWLDNLNVDSNGEDREEALLASSGHDAKIRLWKFATRASSSSEVVEVIDNEDLTTIEGRMR
ncbi:hypothetical protein QTG54_003844 [Skeletonema marinoi]|uniref:Elongator complex protein 2 n=1 Tax=Skeletonema marinoi TaxID=267567 RepID=A0AAD9DHD3_9STRA|nr:hypothetical protein QTG54_003844 [Skeletonema marinoi]